MVIIAPPVAAPVEGEVKKNYWQRAIQPNVGGSAACDLPSFRNLLCFVKWRQDEPSLSGTFQERGIDDRSNIFRKATEFTLPSVTMYTH